MTQPFVLAAQARAVAFPGAIPVVPPLTNALSNFALKGVIQPLDGLDCTDCQFTDVVFEYSGGAFKMQRFKAAGSISLVLKGAAFNTVMAVRLLEALRQTMPKPTPPPRMLKAQIEQTATVDWISLDGLNK